MFFKNNPPKRTPGKLEGCTLYFVALRAITQIFLDTYGDEKFARVALRFFAKNIDLYR